MLDRSGILRAAEDCITRDRQAAYGPPEDSFALIAGHWNWWLGGRLSSPITPYDVAQMMVGLKQARSRGNPGHADSHVDACGYSALAGEMGQRMAD